MLLIAHGSRRAEANDDLLQLAERFAARGGVSIVEACFLELAAPDIATGGARCVAQGAARVLMIPYFLSAGVHLLRDLTAARDDLAARFPDVSFELGQPLGPHPLLDDLVAVRVAELGRGECIPHVASSTEMAARYPRLDVPSQGHSTETEETHPGRRSVGP